MAALCLILFSTGAWAGVASTNVDISDRAYRDLEKLVAFGLCHPPMIDQRPLARGEFARLTAEAIKGFDDSEISPDAGDGFEKFSRRISRHRAIKEILDRMTDEFREELVDMGAIEGHSPLVRGHPFEKMRLDAILDSSAPLTIPVNNGIGSVWATVNPLVHYRSGRHEIDGFQEAIETYHRMRITRHLALLAHPRFEVESWRNGGETDASALLQEGYAVLQAGDAALELGRTQLQWGPGERGGLMFTNEARPLDLIKFSTPSPFRLPWVFKHLGQWKITLFGANLGPDQFFPYPWLTGYRLSYMPVRYLELGFGNATLMGGDGAPPLSALDVFAEFFGFRAAGTSATAPNKTNHIMEASLLLRVPQLAGLELYGVINNEDKRDTLKRFFRDGSSYLAGMYLSKIGNTGASSFRAEFRRMSAIHYRHGIFLSGYTLDRLFIGDDLGPDALGVHTRYDFDISERVSLAGVFDWELRRSDLHATTLDPDGSLGDTIVVANRPHEQRYRFVAEPTMRVSDALEINAMAGYERLLNAGYIQGASMNNWIVGVSFKINFDEHFKFEVK